MHASIGGFQIMGGQAARVLLKHLGEVAHVVKPDLFRCLGHAAAALVEELLGLADAVHHQIVAEALAELLLEQPAEIALGIPQLVRHMAGGNLMGVIRLDKREHLALLERTR